MYNRKTLWRSLYLSYNLGSSLELTGNLSTDNFILGIRRFISRRGYPVEFISDSGTNFAGGERELRETISELDQNKVYKELASKRIKWNFSRT